MRYVLALLVVTFAVSAGALTYRRRNTAMSRFAALAALAATAALSVLWLALGEIRDAARVERWASLRAANPGRSLAELEPGFSMSALSEGLPFMGCALALTIVLFAALFPPKPGVIATSVVDWPLLMVGCLLSIGVSALFIGS
jgi:hypothetical protein